MRGLILLDLDGTLVDRDAVLRAWADEAATAAGEPDVAEWLIAHDRQDGKVRLRESFLSGVAARLGWDTPVEDLLADWPNMFGSRYRLEPAVSEALTDARMLGFRLCVVSNGDAQRQWAKIEAMNLESLVHACVVSGEIGVRKPDRSIFEIAAQKAGCALIDKVWVIGDDPVADIGGAAQIGAKGFWVNRNGTDWPSELPPPHVTFSHPIAALEQITAG
ncbi:HAD family hydrolase [Arthrobacter castelli]|uniref:HAD family hydrolase n=1 Tax=Arthrobacter castelli TaxID=271431 RepID=UPI00041C0AE4|nr:HAD family hydrolase [Arthrobacter castelli]